MTGKGKKSNNSLLHLLTSEKLSNIVKGFMISCSIEAILLLKPQELNNNK